MTSSSSSTIFNRYLSLATVRLSVATKSKEKPSVKNENIDATIDNKVETKKKTIKDDVKPIPSPSSGLKDPNKTYSENIHRLVDEISKLSLVEVMDLNDLLKVSRKFKNTVQKYCFISVIDSRKH